jgi:hypothetical protein
MHPDSSTLPSQVLATCPCSEQKQSRLCLPSLLFENQIYFHPPIYAKVFQVVGKEFIDKIN